MRRAALLVIAGCGRISFDPLPGDGAGDATSCTFGPWGSTVELSSASTTADDYGPTLSSDNLSLYFQSGVGPRDIFVSTRASESDPFGAPQLIAAISSPAHEQGAALSPDELTLYFGSDRTGSMRLYRSTRATKGDPFGPPSIVAELANEDCWGPDLSADGSELFYTHDTGTTNEIWRATYTDATGFVVQGHITELDGPDRLDGFPSLSSDGTTIYWQRSIAGIVRIYMATRAGPGAPFGPASPAGFTGPSTLDQDPAISRDGRFMVFAANGGTVGAVDLMMVARDCL